MVELCHRCHGELPARRVADERSYLRGEESPVLFCSRCSAPQLLLPDHLRVEEAEAASTTGALPPPRAEHGSQPGQVDWRAALGATGVVAAVGAVLVVAGLVSAAASFISVVWTLGGAVVALGLYARRRPLAWMDARVGLRVGTATGILMIAAMGVALAGAGMVSRFGTHRAAGFDAEVAQDFATMRLQMAQRMQEQSQPADLQQKILNLMTSPEVHAGFAIFYLGLVAGLIVVLSAGGGAFAGMMRTQRPGLRRRE